MDWHGNKHTKKRGGGYKMSIAIYGMTCLIEGIYLVFYKKVKSENLVFYNKAKGVRLLF